jgi:hypothetical protein
VLRVSYSQRAVPENMMLSAFTESMDTLSAGAESAQSIILSALPAESMILSVLFGHVITLTAVATKKTTIGDTDDRRLTTLVNSASMAPPISLPPKIAKFCHTLNILLVGHQCRRALLWLYFNSSGGGWLLVVVGRWSVGRSVHNKGCRTLGGLQRHQFLTT